MTMNQNILLDAIIAAECGDLDPEQTAALDRELKVNGEAAQYRQRVEDLILKLRALRQPVPESLDRAVRELIEDGAPEDPWSLLWEVASEKFDLEHRGRFRMPGTAADAVPEAASLEDIAAPASSAVIIQRTFARIEQFSGAEDARVFMAAPVLGTWVGVIVSRSSAPMCGVEVRCTSRGRELGALSTDRRGSFILELGDPAAPARLVFGPPLAVEHELHG